MIKTKAIVLNRKDYNDYDSLIFCYSLDFGKICLLAKGLKRPKAKLAGHLEPFNLIDLMIIKGRERDYIGSAISENSFLNIKSNYYLIDIAGQGIRFLNELIFSNQVDFAIFLLLRDFLINLNNIKSDDKLAELFLIYFKLKLLYISGYDFDFSQCSHCKKKVGMFLNFFDKEVLCLDCYNLKKSPATNFIKINPNIISLKQSFLESDFLKLATIKLSIKDRKELQNLIEIIKKTI
ncbi:MAG TPA: DNA repair protein RecO [bacterium]|nr:DNA repair protein RecO [bacterium]